MALAFGARTANIHLSKRNTEGNEMIYIELAVNKLKKNKNENNAVRVKFYGSNPETGEDEYVILPMEGMSECSGNIYSFMEVSKAAMTSPTNLFFV